MLVHVMNLARLRQRAPYFQRLLCEPSRTANLHFTLCHIGRLIRARESGTFGGGTVDLLPLCDIQYSRDAAVGGESAKQLAVRCIRLLNVFLPTHSVRDLTRRTKRTQLSVTQSKNSSSEQRRSSQQHKQLHLGGLHWPADEHRGPAVLRTVDPYR